MKYSEFLQFQEILEENDITTKEFSKNPKLYEGIIGTTMKNIGSGLLKLAGKGVKYAISKGINKEFKTKLDKDLNTIMDDVAQELGLDKKTAKKDSAVQKVLGLLKEKKIGKKLADAKITKYMEELIDAKSKIVLKSIDDKKALSQDDKDELRIYWGSKIAYIKLNLVAQLHEVGVVTDEKAEEESQTLNRNLNKYLAIIIADARKRKAQRGGTLAKTPTTAAKKPVTNAPTNPPAKTPAVKQNKTTK
jgi:uncharacterized protein YdiU (UPF0061 family)